jgi:hypothetical protein
MPSARSSTGVRSSRRQGTASSTSAAPAPSGRYTAPWTVMWRTESGTSETPIPAATKLTSVAVSEQHFARRRARAQRCGSGRPIQERRAELRLEPPDPLRQRRVGHVQALGGAPEVALLGDPPKERRWGNSPGQRRAGFISGACSIDPQSVLSGSGQGRRFGHGGWAAAVRPQEEREPWLRPRSRRRPRPSSR